MTNCHAHLLLGITHACGYCDPAISTFLPPVIEGATSAIVSHAKQRVDMVVWTSRFKEDPNYFISVPLNTPELKEELERFVKEVLETCGQVQPKLVEVEWCVAIVLALLESSAMRLKMSYLSQGNGLGRNRCCCFPCSCCAFKDECN